MRRVGMYQAGTQPNKFKYSDIVILTFKYVSTKIFTLGCIKNEYQVFCKIFESCIVMNEYAKMYDLF